MKAKLVSPHTMDLPALFGLGLVFSYGKIKISQRLINVPEKTSKMSPGLAGAAYGVSNIKIVKKLSIKVHYTQKSIYSIPMQFKLIFRAKT